MSGHAKLSPSGAHRWMECPGSVAACAGIESPDTDYSLAGSRAHDVAARCLLTEQDAHEFIGQAVYPRYTRLAPFDSAEASAVQQYLNSVRAVLMAEDNCELYIEERVELLPDVWGTADCVIVQRAADKTVKRVIVIDYKHGAGQFVPADDNPQLVIYALGALARLELAPHLVPEVELRIVQPRYTSAAPERSAVLTGAQIANWRVRVIAAADAAREPSAPLRAGEHCHFCPARGECPELRTRALATAQDVFSSIDEAPAAVEPKRVVVGYTPEQLARALAGAEVVEAWLKAVREHAFAYAQSGKPLPGWKLVAKNGHRKWKDDAVAARTLRNYGVEPYTQELISPAQAEKFSKSLKPVVAALTYRPTTGASLVHESDSRPALNPADAFTALPE